MIIVSDLDCHYYYLTYCHTTYHEDFYHMIIVLCFRSGLSLLLPYLLSHNLPRGFLPELVQTTCHDRDTFFRVSK